MGARLHVPFDVFAMQEDVRVSTLVRDDNLGWTCGQCPLDRWGNVVSPGDLLSQAGFVCDMIGTVIPRAGFDRAMIGKLNVYHTANKPGEAQATLSLFRKRFPRAIIVPIPVPHFYYEGMMIEVDVFAATACRARNAASGPIAVDIVDTDEVTWAFVRAQCTDSRSLADNLATIEAALYDENLCAGNLLGDQWFLSGQLNGEADTMQMVRGSGLVSLADSLVVLPGEEPGVLAADLTFSKRQAATRRSRHDTAALGLATLDDGTQYTFAAMHGDPSANLVDQTDAIMSGIATQLAACELSFANVVKLTAHYVGGASAEELHGNMTVRHRHYHRPGPASTGLPVASLLNGDCRIAITATAIR